MSTKRARAKEIVAITQHPMWLIIKEDSVCAERTPPWGAASVEDYSKRVERNISSVEKHPEAMMNYDFSAGELEDVLALYPRLAARIRKAVKRGRLGMVNGTYSQPHLQTLSLEASVRQFEVGLRSIRDHFGYKVQTYAMQEPGYTDQTPQILKAFGYRFMHRGCFVTAMKTVTGGQVNCQTAFCRWQGLDGTQIPLIHWESGVGIYLPDMEEFDPHPDKKFVVLDKYLNHKYAETKDLGQKVRAYIPWGYVEGFNADELIRLDTAAETALIQAETLRALAELPSGRMPGHLDLSGMWKTWLLAQHHDSYWGGAPELRAKCCEWLKDLIRKSSEASSRMMKASFPDTAKGQRSLVLFGVYPKKHRGVTTVAWSGQLPGGFKTPENDLVKAQAMPTGPDKGKLLAPFSLAGAGFKVLAPVGQMPKQQKPKSVKGAWQFRNQHFSAQFGRDGSIKTLKMADGTKIVSKPTGLLTAAKVDSEYLMGWNVLGPFPVKGDRTDPRVRVEQQFSKSQCIDVENAVQLDGTQFRWKQLPPTRNGDVVFPRDGWTGRCNAYYYAEFKWARAEVAVVHFSTHCFAPVQRLEVWLNGKLVHSHGPRPDCGLRFIHRENLSFREGINRILIKTDSSAAPNISVRVQRERTDFDFADDIKSASLWNGPVAQIFEARGHIGTVPVKRRTILYHALPWFEMEVECDFNKTTLGDFFDETAKLALQWPDEAKTCMVHGIGGGSIVPDEPETVFYPVNWLDLGRSGAGLSLINFGTLKHCTVGKTLYTILGWGADDGHFNNRIMSEKWWKRMDLRLDGKQVYRFVIYPHAGGWKKAAVPDVAMSLLRPPVARAARVSQAAMRQSAPALSLKGNLIPTSVFKQDGRLVCRVYEPYGAKPAWTCTYSGKPVTPRVCDAAGNPVKQARPFGIHNLAIRGR